MFDRLEPLAEPKQARGHTLVGDGKDLTITLRFVHGLEEELGRLGLRMVRADAREPHERPCPLRARSQLCHRVAKLCFRAAASRPTRSEGKRRPLPCGGRRQGDPRVSTRVRGLEGARPAAGHPAPGHAVRPPPVPPRRLRRLVDRRCQLPRSCFRILEQLGEPSVDLGTTKRISGLVDPRGEERMREPDALALELDDARF